MTPENGKKFERTVLTTSIVTAAAAQAISLQQGRNFNASGPREEGGREREKREWRKEREREGASGACPAPINFAACRKFAPLPLSAPEARRGSTPARLLARLTQNIGNTKSWNLLSGNYRFKIVEVDFLCQQ